VTAAAAQFGIANSANAQSSTTTEPASIKPGTNTSFAARVGRALSLRAGHRGPSYG
jgi:hypothetical protein